MAEVLKPQPLTLTHTVKPNTGCDTQKHQKERHRKTQKVGNWCVHKSSSVICKKVKRKKKKKNDEVKGGMTS